MWRRVLNFPGGGTLSGGEACPRFGGGARLVQRRGCSRCGQVGTLTAEEGTELNFHEGCP